MEYFKYCTLWVFESYDVTTGFIFYIPEFFIKVD